MTARYTEYTYQQMKDWMEGEMGFRPYDAEAPTNCMEHVWARDVVRVSGKLPVYRIVVWSSVHRELKTTRDCGEDAIRVSLVDVLTDRGVRSSRVYRTKSALLNLRERARELWREVSHGVQCPKCGALMIKRTSKHGEFWGCSRYAPDRPYHCDGTRDALPGKLAPVKLY